jgi:hypothetical protein
MPLQQPAGQQSTGVHQIPQAWMLAVGRAGRFAKVWLALAGAPPPPTTSTLVTPAIATPTYLSTDRREVACANPSLNRATLFS